VPDTDTEAGKDAPGNEGSHVGGFTVKVSTTFRVGVGPGVLVGTGVGVAVARTPPLAA
jgi:hypothetical protein